MIAPVSGAEGDVEDALIRELLAWRARPPDRIEVLHQLDEERAGVQHSALSAGARQAPERFMLGLSQGDSGALEAEPVTEELLGAGEVRHRQRDRA